MRLKEVTRKDYQERILRVLVHIQQNLDEDISLDELAEVANFSAYHFHRVFRGMLGESIGEHIRRLRLERAAFRLQHSDLPVTCIAFEAGYETHEAFTRAFRAMFSQSPSRYRSEKKPLFFQSIPSGIHYGDSQSPEQTQTIFIQEGMMDVQIKKIEPFKVAFVRHTGPYAECKPAWDKLCSWAGPRGLFKPEARFIGISYDDPAVTPPEKLRYDACITLADDIEAQGDVGIQIISGGDYAVTTHTGPYTNLSETYARLCGQWAPSSGRELRSAPCFEVYLNDPDKTPPEKLLTEIYLPLE